MRALHLLGSLAAGVALAAGAALLLPGTASAAPADPPGVVCAKWPYGTRGCDAYLGTLVRADLVRVHHTPLASVSDENLGRLAREMCFNGFAPINIFGMGDPNSLDYRIKYRIVHDVAVPTRCG